MARSRSAVTGFTLVAAQRTIRSHAFEDHVADRDALADEVELGPGRQALDMDVAAEAERVHLGAEPRAEVADGFEVDQRDDLRRDVGEGEAGDVEHLRRPAQFVARRSRRRRPRWRAGPPRWRGCLRRPPAPSRRSVRVAVASSKRASRPASRSFRISIRKFALGRWRGAAGSKPDGAVLDGVGAVVREGLAGREADALERLGRQALHRVAVEGGDAGSMVRHSSPKLTGSGALRPFIR